MQANTSVVLGRVCTDRASALATNYTDLLLGVSWRTASLVRPWNSSLTTSEEGHDNSYQLLSRGSEQLLIAQQAGSQAHAGTKSLCKGFDSLLCSDSATRQLLL